ncbi:hypothetical protein NDN08_000219 [Rhodosorus marinus]|uniref:Reverse transcriptase domain-containing protein n=1 Tax=Rhodosorus marinus TaxID=101924 RepID=A0AAV8UEP6_9RHOD|nr:hypothetical protein NDN08_000219 [Rhodosorus marinus]
MFLSGDFEDLERLYFASLSSFSPSAPSAFRSSRQNRARHAVAGGDLRRAAGILQQRQPVVPYSDDLSSPLRLLFPSEGSPWDSSFESVLEEYRAAPHPSARLVVNLEAVRELVHDAPKGRSPGPSGLRVEYLRFLSDEGLKALAWVVEALVNGDPLCECAWFLVGRSQLCLFSKPGHTASSPAIRPIGLVEVVRKLAARWLVKILVPESRRFFGHVQLGVGYRGGCELLSVLLRSEMAYSPDSGLLSVDLTNAFNRVSRPALMHVTEDNADFGAHLLASCPAVKAPVTLLGFTMAVPLMQKIHLAEKVQLGVQVQAHAEGFVQGAEPASFVQGVPQTVNAVQGVQTVDFVPAGTQVGPW